MVAPFTLAVTLRRLGPDSRSLEFLVLGAVVLVKDGACGLWIHSDDVKFAQDGWRPLPGYRTHDEHRLTVHQDAHRITLAVDGVLASAWAMEAPRAAAPIGVGFKGPRAYRSWISLRDARLDTQ